MSEAVSDKAAFFNDLLKDDDPKFVEHVKEIQRLAAASDEDNSKELTIRASRGRLIFSTKVASGDGPCDKKGSGWFSGTQLDDQFQGGKYKLWLTATTATLQLWNNKEDTQLAEYKGTGQQFHLDTTADKPWVGDWN